MENEDHLKFFGINLENFKNITKRTVDIGGRSIMVVGPNGSGKSSLIQALCSPLDAKIIPTEPIKQGEDRSKIEVVLGGVMGGQNVKYTLELFFSPGNKKGRLVVMNESGEVIKAPATFIKSMIGSVSFDITKWLHESNEKRLKMLKQLTGCEAEIDAINKMISDNKAVKKNKKERAEELESILKNHEFSGDEIDKYSVAIPIEPLQQELSSVAEKQSQWDDIKNKTNGFKEVVKNAEEKIMSASGEIARLHSLIKVQQDIISAQTAEADKANENIRKGEAWLSKNVRPSVEEINSRLTQAVTHNERVNAVSKLADQQREMLKAKQDVAKIDADIEKLENKRASIIEKSQLPIKGLSFTDDQIFIDGLPIEEGQQNTQSLFDISAEVAMALNPTLKVIFLHDASLFDKKNLKSIIEKIESRGYMVVAECVADTGGLEIKFTESDL